MKAVEAAIALLMVIVSIAAWAYQGVIIWTNQGTPMLNKVGVVAVAVLAIGWAVLAAINKRRKP